MTRERRSVRTIDVSHHPEMVELARQVRETREPARLEVDGEEIGTLVPPGSPISRRTKGKPLTENDPIWDLVGVGRSGRGDVSENKGKYLAEAYADLHG